MLKVSTFISLGFGPVSKTPVTSLLVSPLPQVLLSRLEVDASFGVASTHERPSRLQGLQFWGVGFRVWEVR